MDIQAIHSLFLTCHSLSIDTRKIGDNALFVALKGDNFDANTFAAEALAKGASYVIVDNKDYYIDERTILVDNSLEALQELARFHRTYLGLPIIALTGSNGKTTTKELINVVLSKKYNVKATVGNLNNHIGVPLTLLSFDASTEIGIVEMGANHQKEIEFLCTIATPDFGYITNFGKAHLEGFGGIEGVIKGKSEMYDYLVQQDKVVFVNLDDPLQASKTKTLRRFTFGYRNPEAGISIHDIQTTPLVSITFNHTTVNSHLIGLYNANNINAAITIGHYFNINDTEIKDAIEHYTPTNNRSQLIRKNTNEIILDAYNANPSSMKAAIENFIQLQQSNKMMILGDMFELGAESLQEHQNIIDLLIDTKDILVYFVGHDFYSRKISLPHFKFFSTFEAVADVLKAHIITDHFILIKGSRGMALERCLQLLPE